MKANKILFWSIIAGVYSILLIPFFVANSMFFPFITGKNFAFRIIVEIVLGLWLILLFRDKSFAPKRSMLLYSFSAFIVAIALADFFGANPYRSFWSNFERMEGLIAHLHLFALFLVLGSVLNTKKLWTYFFNSALVASILMAFYGIFQLAGIFEIHQGSTRIDGPIGNSAYFAIYMLFHVFLALFLLLRSSKMKMQIFYGAVAILDSIMVYYTATRGAILGLIGGLFLTALLVAIFEKERKILRKISIGAIAVIVLIIISFFALRNQGFVKNSLVLSRFASISTSDGTTESRFMIWNMALQGWKEHPILGWGQENFILVFEKYYNPKMFGQEPWFDRTHNVILDWLIAGGALGFLSYISLFVASVWCIWKKKTQLSITDRAILTGLLSAYFFHNLFVFDNLTSYILFVFILSYFQFLSSEKYIDGDKGNKFVGKETKGMSEGFQSILIPLVIIAMPVGIYFINIPAILTSTSLIHAFEWQSADAEKSLAYFKESISYNTFGNPEVRSQILSSVFGVINSKASDSFKQSYLQYIKEQMEIQIKEEPLDARYPFFLGQFLDQFGLSALAEQNLKLALTLSPKKQDIIMRLGISYFNSGQKEKALATMKEAYDLETDNEIARTLYAAFAIYSNKDDVVKSVLLPAYHSYLVPDDRIVDAYIKTGQLQKYIALDAEFMKQEIKGGLLTDIQIKEVNARREAFLKKVDEYKKANPQK